MNHASVLLCGLVLAGALSIPVGAGDAAQTAPGDQHPGQHPGQRLARPDASASQATAPEATEGACLAMIPDDPAGAVDYAEAWSHRHGADAAARCHALAVIAQGDPESGAGILDGLSHDATLPASRRALLAGEAGTAWLLASRTDRALASASLAAELDPSPDHVIEHARTALAAHQPRLAIGDLSPVLARNGELPDALVVRAAALREIGALDRARADIDVACRLEPDAPEALLERGILRERAGDLDGARGDWSRVIAVSPDTHEADLAQQDLALLDAGPEAR